MRALRLTRPRLVVVVAMLAVAVPACGDNEGARRDLEDAISATRSLAYRFAYRDSRPEREIEVNGFTEDDFRVKARVDFDGEQGYEQVVSDDTLAVRFLRPGALQHVVDKTVSAEETETELEGINSFQVLQSRRWLVDPVGAPLFGSGAGNESEIGNDPVRDALSALDYVEEAVAQSVAVEEFSPDDLSPVFPASEDNFPQPEDGSGVTRYDLRRPDLPQFDPTGAGGDQEIISTQHFRKLVVYVKDDVVIRVIERVEAIGSFYDDVVGFILRLLDDVEVSEEAKDAFRRFSGSDVGSGEVAQQRSSQLLEVINVLLQQVGFEPILLREMVLDLSDHGQFNAVALPSLDDPAVIEGSALALTISGRGLDEEALGAEGEGGVEADVEGGTGTEGEVGDTESPDAPPPEGSEDGADLSSLGAVPGRRGPPR